MVFLGAALSREFVGNPLVGGSPLDPACSVLDFSGLDGSAKRRGNMKVAAHQNLPMPLEPILDDKTNTVTERMQSLNGSPCTDPDKKMEKSCRQGNDRDWEVSRKDSPASTALPEIYPVSPAAATPGHFQGKVSLVLQCFGFHVDPLSNQKNHT